MEEEEIHDNSEGNTRGNGHINFHYKQGPVDLFNRKSTQTELLIWGNFRNSQVRGIWSPSVRKTVKTEDAEKHLASDSRSSHTPDLEEPKHDKKAHITNQWSLQTSEIEKIHKSNPNLKKTKKIRNRYKKQGIT